jgi:hypothetical protein
VERGGALSPDPDQRERPLLGGCVVAVADTSEGARAPFAGVGQRAGVLLTGGDAPVSESFLDDDDVGAAGEQPGGVGGAQVVEGDLVVEFRGFDRGRPVLAPEVVPRQRRGRGRGEK